MLSRKLRTAAVQQLNQPSFFTATNIAHGFGVETRGYNPDNPISSQPLPGFPLYVAYDSGAFTVYSNTLIQFTGDCRTQLTGRGVLITRTSNNQVIVDRPNPTWTLESGKTGFQFNNGSYKFIAGVEYKFELV